MWAGPSCFLSCGDGYVGELLELQQGLKDPLEVPEFRCDLPRDASVEMALISTGGDNPLDFLELRQVLPTYDGDFRDPLWWPQERPVPMGVAQGPLGIPLPSMPGRKTMCGVGVEPEGSSPVLTWTLRYFWSLPRGVSPRLEWGRARSLSSRAVAAVSRFPSRGQGICGFPSRLSHEAFPQLCSKCHRGVSRSSA